MGCYIRTVPQGAADQNNQEKGSAIDPGWPGRESTCTRGRGCLGSGPGPRNTKNLRKRGTARTPRQRAEETRAKKLREAHDRKWSCGRH
jgi:hypothetical protein